MVTKKAQKTMRSYPQTCIEVLLEAHKNPDFLGKTENKREILIKFKDLTYSFKFTKEEYKEFKKLEREAWANDRR